MPDAGLRGFGLRAPGMLVVGLGRFRLAEGCDPRCSPPKILAAFGREGGTSVDLVGDPFQVLWIDCRLLQLLLQVWADWDEWSAWS